MSPRKNYICRLCRYDLESVAINIQLELINKHTSNYISLKHLCADVIAFNKKNKEIALSDNIPNECKELILDDTNRCASCKYTANLYEIKHRTSKKYVRDQRIRDKLCKWCVYGILGHKIEKYIH